MSGINFKALSRSPKAFRNELKVDTGSSSTQKLGEVIEPWQNRDFIALDDTWRRAVGVKTRSDAQFYRGGYLERPRGHSKTSDIATSVAWALGFSQRRIQGLAASGDKEQAAILKEAVGRLVYTNPWLEQVIDVQRGQIINPRTGSKMLILSSDAFSSYGHLPDFIVADELSHWQSDALWTTLASSALKRPHCAMLIITNAGFVGTWQHRIQQELVRHEGWYTSILDKPEASWINEEGLAEQRILLPRHDYLRLWHNQWTSKSGDALDPADIDAAFAAKVPVLAKWDPNYEYIAGLDLGVTQDHSSLVILGKHIETGRVRHCRSWNWAPPAGGKVDLREVERTLITECKRFRVVSLVADPVQAEQMIQAAESASIICESRYQRSRQHIEQAQAFLETFAGRNIDIPLDERLEEQIRAVQVKSMQYGVRLVLPREKGKGHADEFSAMVIALAGLKAFDVAGMVAHQANPATFETVDPEDWETMLRERAARPSERTTRKPITAGGLAVARRKVNSYRAMAGWDPVGAERALKKLAAQYPDTEVSRAAEDAIAAM